MARMAEDRILYFERHLDGFCEAKCSGDYRRPACKVCDS
jgi:hypothetical protein